MILGFVPLVLNLCESNLRELAVLARRAEGQSLAIHTYYTIPYHTILYYTILYYGYYYIIYYYITLYYIVAERFADADVRCVPRQVDSMERVEPTSTHAGIHHI